MQKTLKWSVAGLVTIAAFAAVTRMCGALVLAHVLKDPAVRWGIAGGLGVAIAALAASWGHSFAEGGGATEATSCDASVTGSQASKTGHGNTRNKISGGIFHGSVTQGRDAFETRPDPSVQAESGQPER